MNAAQIDKYKPDPYLFSKEFLNSADILTGNIDKFNTSMSGSRKKEIGDLIISNLIATASVFLISCVVSFSFGLGVFRRAIDFITEQG
jgi:hypothetical protein